MRARYDAMQNQNDSNCVHSSKYTTKYLMKKGHEKQRQKFVTNIFIRNEMKKLSYQKYIRSPFAFIDGIDSDDRPSNEFVYLNEIAPYDLEIVPSSQLINNNNYYTLSSKGLTHFYELDGTTQVLFTPLDQWQREYYLYTSMMKIPFFKRFRIWKCFRMWKKCIKPDKTKLCNKIMNGNLFILNKYLTKPLIEIRKLCCSITEWKLFVLKDNKNKNQPLTLKQFLNLQSNHRIALENNYNQCVIK